MAIYVKQFQNMAMKESILYTSLILKKWVKH